MASSKASRETRVSSRDGNRRSSGEGSRKSKPARTPAATKAKGNRMNRTRGNGALPKRIVSLKHPAQEWLARKPSIGSEGFFVGSGIEPDLEITSRLSYPAQA